MDRTNQSITKKYPRARIQGKPNRLWKTNSTLSIPDDLNERFENVYLDDVKKENTVVAERQRPGRSENGRGQWSGNRNKRSKSTSQFLGRGFSNIGHKNEKSKDETKGYTKSSANFHRKNETDLLDKKKNDAMASGYDKRNIKKIFGYKRLLNLFTLDPEFVLMLLVNKDEGFIELLNKQKLSPDVIVLIARVLSYACESTFSQTKIALLMVICNSYVGHLIQYIMFLPLQTVQEKFLNKSFWNSSDQFFTSIIHICSEIIRLIPSTAYETLPKVVNGLQIVVDSLQRAGLTFDRNLLDKVNNLSEQLTVLIAEREVKKREVIENSEIEYNPPDSFRDISSLPTIEDIKHTGEVFLKPNIINGKYLNPEHYLDLQFRLLKEDFISPLRNGVQEYCNLLLKGAKKIQAVDNIRIYQKVKFLSTTCINNELCALVDFSIGYDKKFLTRIENSKRLIFGSLLLFTFDNFNTMFFGTVVSRDEKLLKIGQIAVKLQLNVPYKMLFKGNCVMVESEIYFEPYYQVLSALQEMEKNNFPMQRYIVDVEVDSKPPKYIRNNPLMRLYGRRQVHNINVLQNDWPSSSELLLDESQYEALKVALTHEFCVIQGPPGTGKTYVGLYIANILLRNYTHWYLPQNHLIQANEENDQHDMVSEIGKEQPKNTNSPIVVVCYTNHALDQFLEGILKITQNVVRIGNRSKSEALNKYNLKNKRFSKRLKISNSLIQTLRFEMMDLKCEILSLQEMLTNLNSRKIVFDFETVYETQMTLAERKKWILDGIKKFNCEGGLVTSKHDSYSEIQTTESNLDFMDSDEEYCQDDFLDRINFDDDDDDDDVDDDFVNVGSLKKSITSSVLFNLTYIEDQCEGLKNALAKEEIDPSYIEDTIENIQKYEKKLNYLNYWLQQGPNELLHKPVSIKHINLHTLNVNDRWNLYWVWCKKFEDIILNKLSALENKYQALLHQYGEVQQIEDIGILRESFVVGLTTTGAAKYRSMLQALKSRIVIVEEAAEVSETHIVVSLTSHCEHLILIGDHKQLRPSTASYKLARHFGLDISLFERMVRNGIHCSTLSVQHRMKPEIALLVSPIIYPNLQNHSSVEEYPSIIGIPKNLYFITHKELETQSSDSKSRQNSHEADFILHLCRHLILQGYEPEDITILTTYNGQMFYLRKKRQNMKLLHKVQITVVDNFQGEENKIILLSLVRSNLEEKVGFLSIENRVCVALSRAKHALYIIGNMDMLKKKTDIWLKVYHSLKKQESIGLHLTLQCKIHNLEFTQVSKGADFQLCPEGGCSKQCGVILECGHECLSVCHVKDREHLLYKCQQPCQKFCERNHPCKKSCFVTPCPDCTTPVEHLLSCGHHVMLECRFDPNKYNCTVSVKKKLSICGHEVYKPCWTDEKTIDCPEPCINRLPCGHQCTKTCHLADDPDHIEFKCMKDCARYNANCSQNHLCKKRCYEECSPCQVVVLKRYTNCDHKKLVHCNSDVDAELCEKSCKRILPCGHLCKKKCFEYCEPKQCEEKVKKIAICGHEILTDCGKEPNRKECKGKCPLILSCGHRCDQSCKSCANGCSGLLCKELVDHSFNPVCGHNFKIACYKKKLLLNSESFDLLRACTEPCKMQLECGHQCGGACGLCFQGAMHFPCIEQCDYPLICGHKCESKCRQTCPPCLKKCNYKCHHSECALQCGEPCKPCKEPCLRHCEHIKCLKRCSDICGQKPCYYPCTKKLICNHNCIGFCGEPCPPKCRICDREEITTIIFGSEDESHARFVLLEDCGHVIEADALETYLHMKPDYENDKQINILSCPLCKTPINKTQRYADLVKNMYKDIINVKKKIFGTPADIDVRKKEALKKIVNLKRSNSFKNVEEILIIIENLSKSLSTVHEGNRVSINKFELNLCEIQIEALVQIEQILSKTLSCTVLSDSFLYRLKCIATFLLLKRTKISKQEINDLDQELERLNIFSKLCIIQSSAIYKTNSSPVVKTLFDRAMKIIMKFEPFTNDLLKSLKVLIQSIQESLKVNIVTEVERQQVVAAMRAEIKQGAWYKCSKGHFYTIGDCGGAMTTSKCIDCGETVGGSNHALLSTNRHAGEMDNSRYPAWSDLANMNNFIFD